MTGTLTADPFSRKTPVLPISALALLAACIMFVAYASTFTLWDDAFISFRYSENLASGHGLVFNPGERVEGYTNFLWVLLIASADILQIPPWAASRFIGLLSVIGIVLLPVLYAVKRNALPVPIALGTSILLALNPQVIRWSSSGLETPLVTFLVLLAVLLTVTSTRKTLFKAAIAWFLTLLCRPDSVVILFANCLSLLMNRSDRRKLLYLLPMILLLILPYVLWRKWYFGMWFPATYHTRMGYTWAQLQSGLLFLRNYLAAYPAFAAGLLPVLLWLKSPNSLIRTSGLAVILHYLFVICVGGDWMAFRFFSVITGFELMLCIYTAWYLWNTAQKKVILHRILFRFSAALIILALFAVTFSGYPDNLLKNIDPKLVFDHRTNRSSVGDLMGRFARECKLQNEWLITPYAEVALASRLPCFNPLGLTSLQVATSDTGNIGKGLVAHEKIDWETGLRLNPIFVYPDYTLDQHVHLEELSGKGVLRYRFPGYTSSGYQALRTPTSDDKFSKFAVRLDIRDRFLTWWDIHFMDVPPRKL